MTGFQKATTAVLGALMLGLQAGCGANRSPTVESRQAISNVTTMQDLESQTVRPFREQRPAEDMSQVRITGFGEPSMRGARRMRTSIGGAIGSENSRIRSVGTHKVENVRSMFVNRTVDMPQDRPVT